MSFTCLLLSPLLFSQLCLSRLSVPGTQILHWAISPLLSATRANALSFLSSALPSVNLSALSVPPLYPRYYTGYTSLLSPFTLSALSVPDTTLGSSILLFSTRDDALGRTRVSSSQSLSSFLLSSLPFSSSVYLRSTTLSYPSLLLLHTSGLLSFLSSTLLSVTLSTLSVPPVYPRYYPPPFLSSTPVDGLRTGQCLERVRGIEAD